MVTIDSLQPLLDKKHVVLGLDAYGVIYNDDGLFDPVKSVFDYCDQHHIPLFMMTNNATQSITDISNKMHAFGVPIAPEYVISSGCGCYMLDDIHDVLSNKKVFVYGFSSSQFYVEMADGIPVSQPEDADVIVFAASLGANNHHWYKRVHDVLIHHPTMPVVCINPDYYIKNKHGYKPVMGLYAHQMAHQLNAGHWIWMGKPYSRFSTLVKTVLTSHGFDHSALVFCDDNPMNVQQLSHDLNCAGVVISDTGIAQRFSSFQHDRIFELPVCTIQ